MYHHLQLVYVLLVPVGISCLMMLAGFHKKALEKQRHARICPSCDHEASRCRCRR